MIIPRITQRAYHKRLLIAHNFSEYVGFYMADDVDPLVREGVGDIININLICRVPLCFIVVVFRIMLLVTSGAFEACVSDLSFYLGHG